MIVFDGLNIQKSSMHKCPKVDLTNPSLVNFGPPDVTVGQKMRITNWCLLSAFVKVTKPREVFSVN